MSWRTARSDIGQGLSQAVGVALADRILRRDSRTFCPVSDGELQDGQIWEAAMSAAHYRLANVVVLIDITTSRPMAIRQTSWGCTHRRQVCRVRLQRARRRRLRSGPIESRTSRQPQRRNRVDLTLWYARRCRARQSQPRGLPKGSRPPSIRHPVGTSASGTLTAMPVDHFVSGTSMPDHLRRGVRANLMACRRSTTTQIRRRLHCGPEPPPRTSPPALHPSMKRRAFVSWCLVRTASIEEAHLRWKARRLASAY